MQISAVLISFNEEQSIAAAIESLGWADEVLVVDSESTDRTREIAKGLGAKVIIRQWPGFSQQKQFAVDNALHEWVFSLDADERVSAELRASIEEVRSAGSVASGFSISRLPYYMGRPIRHGGWYPDRHVRLFDRTQGRWSDVVIHESVVMKPEARVETLRGDILHYTVDSAVEHHRMIGERYAPLGARQMFENGRTTTPLRAAASGFGAFFKSFVLQLGFLDGFPGYCIGRFAAQNAFLKHAILLELLRGERDRQIVSR